MTTETLNFLGLLTAGLLMYGIFGSVFAVFIYQFLVEDTGRGIYGRNLYKGELLFAGTFWIFIVLVLFVIALFNMGKNLTKIIKNVLTVFASKIQ